ncbi:MAG TPA: dTDP-4-dehydrorhamnose reductase [Rudaea sp.]|nr:dTDP-4-dehydrorhamnose reductase [Rudaea sp.]
MRLLLLGANGQVGYELMRTLAPLGELICATRDKSGDASNARRKVDLAEPDCLREALDAVAADVVVNAAAYTAVDRAEDEPELADCINHRALAVIGNWAAARRALVVHYSTDYVFDGTATRPYGEDDAAAPLGVYGRSKLAGEIALRESHCAHLILRTAWVYAARGHNFLRTMLRLARERDALSIVDDQRGAPTTARLIADVTATVLARVQPKEKPVEPELGHATYHLCAAGDCTWFEFARAIFARAHAAGLIDHPIRLTPIATADYPTRALRPAYSVLDTRKIRDTFGLDLPDWEHGLDATIQELTTST